MGVAKLPELVEEIRALRGALRALVDPPDHSVTAYADAVTRARALLPEPPEPTR